MDISNSLAIISKLFTKILIGWSKYDVINIDLQHNGITATYHNGKSLFAWPNMNQYIKDYISTCEVCAQAKPEHCRLLGLLQPLPVPQHAWHTISLDFIEGLPKSKTFDTILVVIDKLTK